jgi:hypothetical protein
MTECEKLYRQIVTLHQQGFVTADVLHTSKKLIDSGQPLMCANLLISLLRVHIAGTRSVLDAATGGELKEPLGE